MRLDMIRYDSTQQSTIGVIVLKNEFVCFTLEDGYKKTKIPKVTRIPAGEYQIIPRMYGEHYERYSKRWGLDHFVPELKDVPNYTDILIHIGNTIHDTDGCILTGSKVGASSSGNYEVYDSTNAYLRLHKIIKKAFENGEDVTLNIIDLDLIIGGVK